MRLQDKLRVLEQMMMERRTPSQEKLIAAYLRNVLTNEPTEEVEDQYEKVRKFIPKMH